VLTSGSRFRTDGPNPLTSAAYAQDFAEVKGWARRRASRARPSRLPSPASSPTTPSRHVEPYLGTGGAGPGPHARRRSATLRDDERCRCRRADRMLDRQGSSDLLAPHHRDSVSGASVRLQLRGQCDRPVQATCKARSSVRKWPIGSASTSSSRSADVKPEGNPVGTDNPGAIRATRRRGLTRSGSCNGVDAPFSGNASERARVRTAERDSGSEDQISHGL
jgi:hypothetical protein